MWKTKLLLKYFIELHFRYEIEPYYKQTQTWNTMILKQLVKLSGCMCLQVQSPTVLV